MRAAALSMLSVTPVLVGILGASPVLAQSAQPQTAQAPVEEIVVTGTRIVRDGYEAPTPVTVLDSSKLEQNATSNVTYALTTLPAIMGSGTTQSQVTNGGAGLAGTNRLSLRGLGPGRTLVLVDGHRVPASTPAGGVDVNTLPEQLISRVDVVTGGASAVYGSDAVAGVVNFVLDKEFTGVKGEVSGGGTTYGDDWNYKAVLTGGMRFAGDRGHALLSLEDVYDEGVGAYSRDWLYKGRQRVNNNAYSATCGCPQYLILDSVGYTQMSPGGMIFTGPLKGTIFTQGGAAARFTYGNYTAEPYTSGGDWRSTDVRPTNPLSPHESRQSLFARSSYDVTDNIQAYAQYAFTSEFTRAVISTFLMQGSNGPLIAADNAYLPAAIKAQMTANKLTNFRLGTYNADLGPAVQETTRTSYTYQGGLSGNTDAFGTNWKWDAYGQFGLTKTLVTIPNHISKPKYLEAVDAVVSPTTGQIVCRVVLTNPASKCSPWDALGTGVNAQNSGGYYYFLSPSVQDARMVENVIGATATGEPFSNWAGPVSLAADFQHRFDAARAVVDADSLAANHLFGNTAPLNGSDQVTEGALETVVPLAKGTPWAENWDLNAAVRFTGYENAGYVTTWKVGTTYAPVSDFRIRATRSRDIRAPNIQELFLSANTNFSDNFDPVKNTSVFIPITTLGNPTLQPERADNTQVGAVFQPSFLPGLSASVDYWKISMKGIISALTQANIIGLCYDGTRPDLCANVIRDSAGNLTQVFRRQANFAVEDIDGLDIEASYNLPLDTVSSSLAGTLNLRAFLGIYLNDIQQSAIAKPVQLIGSGDQQKWRLNATMSYQLDPISAALTVRSFSSGIMSATWLQCTTGCPASTTDQQTVSDNFLPGATYLDFSLSYNFQFGDSGKATAFLNVRNLTDKDPAWTETGNAFMAGVSSASYDVLGRSIRAGLRFGF
jgi:outer membrane receptor protein involved in Fe transport